MCSCAFVFGGHHGLWDRPAGRVDFLRPVGLKKLAALLTRGYDLGFIQKGGLTNFAGVFTRSVTGNSTSSAAQSPTLLRNSIMERIKLRYRCISGLIRRHWV